MIIPPYPQAGFPVDALWGRQVVDALRASRIVCGKGLRKTADGSGGQVLEATDQSTTSPGASGIDLSKFALGCSFSGSTCTVKAGDWCIGESELETPDTDIPISQDHQYVGFEVDTVAKTMDIIGPATSKAVFKSSRTVFRTWLHQCRYIGGKASLERTHLGSIQMPGRFSQ
jgi:hypothetical protein